MIQKILPSGPVRLRALLTLAALLLASTETVRAGAIIAYSGAQGPGPAGVVASTSGVHVTNQSGPTGDWFRATSLFNSNNVPTAILDPGPYGGPYTPPSGGGLGSPLDTGVVSYPGGNMNPEGRTVMSYSPGTWNTRDSFARITPLGLPPVGIVDATAEAEDPANYSATFILDFKPEVRFSTTLEAGLQLLAQTVDVGQTSSAQIFGAFTTNALIDEQLWTFNWTADSANPTASDFFFQSDPSLGLDDAAITALFLSKVTSVGGVHTLTENFTIEAIVPVFVSDNPTVEYSFGGDIHYNAHATPEPATLGLLLVGVAFLRRRTA